MPQIPRGLERWARRQPAIAVTAVSLLMTCPAAVAAQRSGSQPAQGRIEDAQRIEGAAILDLADAAAAGKPVPADFAMRWHPDFLKAQRGTFVPFVLTVDGPNVPRTPALLYVRAVAKGTQVRKPRPGREDDRRQTRGKPDPLRSEPDYPVDIIFPIESQPGDGGAFRVVRGFSVAPGEYDVCLVLRERPRGGSAGTPLRAAVVTQRITVPNFWTDELAMSSVILADRLTLLTEPSGPEELLERPYVIGLNDIQPARDDRFGKDEELICVFLVYNPKVGLDKTFDVQVEYHFYRRNSRLPERPAASAREAEDHPPTRDGETYVNHTVPQRFTTALMGAQFDPSAGQPIMAGQGIPLAGFQEGDYRLMIKVTDFLAGKTLTRDVNFTVGS